MELRWWIQGVARHASYRLQSARNTVAWSINAFRMRRAERAARRAMYTRVEAATKATGKYIALMKQRDRHLEGDRA